VRKGPAINKLNFQSYLLGKMLLTKKAHEKSLTPIEQSLMAGLNCQAGPGKDGAAPSLAGVAFIEGGG
jgi:hypothetical protein